MNNDIVEISGNTYPVREELKRLGARWNPGKRVWTISSDRADKARAIVCPSAAALQEVAREIIASDSVVWSDEQVAIFKWFANGQGNLVVQARAGTGKTTTIKEAFRHARELGRLLYAVFNKKNQKEAAAKILDRRVQVSTLHSLGLSFIRSVWRDVQPDDEVEADRLRAVCADLPEDVSTPVLKLVGFCKNLTVKVPELDTVMDIADARNISVSDELEQDFPISRLAQLAIDCLKAALVRDSQDRISFNDMVWLPVAAGWVKPIFDLVVVDEAQDMNMPQLMMAERASKGRICVVGDDRQAIYGFRGAATDGMHLMRQRLNAAQLGLTVTYRCPKSVVSLANQIVPDYTAAPSAPEGSVIDCDLRQAVAGLVVGDAVLSRLNAPLMNIALSLLRRDVPARIEGRDIGKLLVGRVRKFKAKSVPDFLKKVAAWEKKQSSRIIAGGGRHVNSKLETVRDEALTLSTVAQDCENIDAVVTKILGLFEDSDRAVKPAVVCSSVHKAKGLEWNRVCLVMDTFKKGTEGEEANILYVAITRAKDTLFRGVGAADEEKV